MVGVPPFTRADAGLADVRVSCRAWLADAPPAGDAAVAGGTFLPGRGEESAGRWVVRVGFPVGPGWEEPEADGAAGVFVAAPEFSRRVTRVLSDLADRKSVV